MRISEISPEIVISYLRGEPEEMDSSLVNAIMRAAKSYICNYTGIPETPVIEGAESIDDYEDLSIAFLVLCQDLYDNRTMTPDTKYANSANKTIDTILGMHARNLI